MPKVSVIVPVYNVEQYLAECLDSIISQTLQDIEIICIDDGSTDNSGKILDDYAVRDGRIRVIHQENCGQGIARNRGIKIASGDYIAFVDPDDWVAPEMFDEMYIAALKNNADIVQCDYAEVYQNGHYKNILLKSKQYDKFKISPNSCFTYRDILPTILTDIVYMAWSRIYKREMVNKNNILFSEYKRYEDHCWSLEAILCANKIFYIDKVFYKYRIRPSSIVHCKWGNCIDSLNIIKTIEDIISKYNLEDVLKKNFSDYKLHVCQAYLNSIDLKDRKIFLNKVKAFIDNDDYLKLKRGLRNTRVRSIIKNIFSIENFLDGGVKHKVITILGYRIYIEQQR